MPDFASPNVGNYSIPKGNLWFTPAAGFPGAGVRRHMGNCPAAELTLDVETLQHFSSMAGVRTQDFTATTSKTAALAVTLEEMTRENLLLAMLGDTPTTDTDGNAVFNIGVNTAITGLVEIIGNGDIGPKYTTLFPSVTFVPSGAIPFIGEEINQIELNGEVNATGTPASFGTQTLQDTGTA